MTVLNLQINATGNDGTWQAGGSFWTTGLDFGKSGSASSSVSNIFLRFASVTVPNAATIDSAILTGQSYVVNRTGATCNLLLNASDEDNATAPTSKADIDGRAATTASVAWNAVPSWTASTNYSSPEILSVVQEVVDRAGWSSGNAMLVYVRDNGSSNSAFRQWKDHDSGSSTALKLDITYTEGGGADPEGRLKGGKLIRGGLLRGGVL